MLRSQCNHHSHGPHLPVQGERKVSQNGSVCLGTTPPARHTSHAHASSTTTLLCIQLASGASLLGNSLSALGLTDFSTLVAHNLMNDVLANGYSEHALVQRSRVDRLRGVLEGVDRDGRGGVLGGEEVLNGLYDILHGRLQNCEVGELQIGRQLLRRRAEAEA